MEIETKELTQQIKLAIQDIFEAQVSVDKQTINLVFNNGQKFSLQVNKK